jgi:hypothetical protein
MTRTHIAVAVATVAAASAIAGEAHAQAVTATVVAPAPVVAVESSGGGAAGPGVSVGGVAGFGFVGRGYGAAFAIGARGGYTLPMHLYVGGELGYDISSVGIFNIQAEIGYAIGLESVSKLLIRPYVGLGFGDAFVSAVCDGGVCVGGGGGAVFLLSPGAVVAYDVTPHVFVGGDVRIPIFLGSGSTAGFDLFGTGGYKF